MNVLEFINSNTERKCLLGTQTLHRIISMKYVSCANIKLQQLTAIFLLKKRGRNTIKNGKDYIYK